jgi:ribosomal protein L24
MAQRSTGAWTQTGRIEKLKPIHISNVMLVGTEGKPTCGYEVAADGSRERVDRKSGNAGEAQVGTYSD